VAQNKYREIFMQEADDLLETLEEALLELESHPEDLEQVAAAFRALHTLKGSGSMAGLDELAELAHELEAIFDELRNGRMQVSAALISLSLAAKDQLRAEVDGMAEAAVRLQLITALKELQAESAGTDPAGSPGTPSTTSRALRTFDLVLRFSPDVLSDGTNLGALFDELAGLGSLELEASCEDAPSLEALDPERLYLDWTGQLVTEATAEEIRDVFIFLADDSGLEVKERAPEAARAGPVQRADQGPSRPAASRIPTLKVPVPKLDGLVDLVGELVIVKSRLNALSSTHQLPELTTVSEDLDRLTNELRDQTMGLRMLPMSSSFKRFQRLVRDLSVELDKDLSFQTEGGDTELDKTVLDRLGDPLVHLVRNAADHGIESRAEREAAGKPAVGTIRLKAEQTEAKVVITLSDDGKGLEPSKIRAKAVERGLIQADDELSEAQLFNLIFAPGFSTAEAVSKVSGRGVGMDAVARSIKELSGTVQLSSQPGKGTTVTIRLPLSLAIMEGLLVRIGGDPFVFPLSLVEECVEPPETRGEGPETLLTEVRGELVPFIRLGDWFSSSVPSSDPGQIVVAHLAQGRYGFLVDRVIGQHQTVLKDLGPVGRGVEGLSGATILGDGTVALILDASAIVDEVQRP